MGKRGKIIVLGVGLILIVFLVYTGVLTVNGLCGFKPGLLAGPGKEWSCTCIGKVTRVDTSDSEREYCTGLNFSYNRLMDQFSDPNSQHPVYQPEWDGR